jgi:hypothetical protein
MLFHSTLRSRSVKARVSTFIDEVKVATGIQVISDGGVGYDEEKGGGGSNMTTEEMEIRSQAVRAQTEQHRQTREKMRQKYFVDRSTNN